MSEIETTVAALNETLAKAIELLKITTNVQAETSKQLVSLTRAVDGLAKDVKEMHEHLYVGNGEKSLITRVNLLEVDVEELLGEKKEKGEKRLIDRKGGWAIIGAIVTGILSLAAAIAQCGG